MTPMSTFYEFIMFGMDINLKSNVLAGWVFDRLLPKGERMNTGKASRSADQAWLLKALKQSKIFPRPITPPPLFRPDGLSPDWCGRCCPRQV